MEAVVAPAGVWVSPLDGVAFGPTGVGLTAAAQTLTLANHGDVALTIQNIAVTGDFAIVTNGSTSELRLRPVWSARFGWSLHRRLREFELGR